jgi:hypothetical protein
VQTWMSTHRPERRRSLTQLGSRLWADLPDPVSSVRWTNERVQRDHTADFQRWVVAVRVRECAGPSSREAVYSVSGAARRVHEFQTDSKYAATQNA